MNGFELRIAGRSGTDEAASGRGESLFSPGHNSDIATDFTVIYDPMFAALRLQTAGHWVCQPRIGLADCSFSVQLHRAAVWHQLQRQTPEGLLVQV